MQHKLATKIVAFFSHRRLIEKNNEEWCVYFIETRIFSYIAFLLIFFILLPFANPGRMIILLLFVLLIRRRSGGYHCKTEQRCFLLSLLVVALGLIQASLLEEKYAAQLLILILSSCAIFTGPVNQPELHLSREEFCENANRLRKMTVLLTCVALIMISMRVSVASYCVTGLFIAGVSIVAGKFIQVWRKIQCS